MKNSDNEKFLEMKEKYRKLLFLGLGIAFLSILFITGLFVYLFLEFAGIKPKISVLISFSTIIIFLFILVLIIFGYIISRKLKKDKEFLDSYNSKKDKFSIKRLFNFSLKEIKHWFFSILDLLFAIISIHFILFINDFEKLITSILICFYFFNNYFIFTSKK